MDENKLKKLFNEAKQLSGEENWEASIAKWDEIIPLLPDGKNKARAYYNRGNAKGKRGILAAAIADFDRALEIDPKLSGAYNNRGSVKGHMGDHAAAIADFDRALEIDPNNAAAHSNRNIAKRIASQREKHTPHFVAPKFSVKKSPSKRPKQRPTDVEGQFAVSSQKKRQPQKLEKARQQRPRALCSAKRKQQQSGEKTSHSSKSIYKMTVSFAWESSQTRGNGDNGGIPTWVKWIMGIVGFIAAIITIGEFLS